MKLEVSNKYDTSMQASAEEAEVLREQLRYKQELVEQFENHLQGLADQHQTQVQEMQAVNDQLKVRVADFEA